MFITQKCWCGKEFLAKAADVKRGWGKSCCKAHAAHAREKKLDRLGYRSKHRIVEELTSEEQFCDIDDDARNDVEVGWDSHKDSF